QPMNDFNLLIDGKLVPGDHTMPVLNPATEEVLAQCPRASKSQLDAAVSAAKAAFPAWAAIPLLLLSSKLPSALLAGNTIVVKPAPTTPLSTLKFAELVKDVLPHGVLNVI